MNRESRTSKLGFFNSFSGHSPRILIELVVIVASILFALAIDEWRANSENKEAELGYLQQLIIDVRSTEESITSVLESNASSDATALRLMAIFEAGRSVEPAEIRRLLREVYYYTNPTPVLGTADALVATGDLRLIRDSRIKAEITRYLSRTRDFWLVPIYDLESDYRAHYARLTKVAAAYGVSPTRPIVDGQVHQSPDVGAFLADTEAYAEVLRLLFNKGEFKGYRTGLAADAATIREILEEYVNSNQ
ncbi:MAG: hypothetical protein ACI89U_000988 [Gammaproteobacteria bacterium]